MLRVRNIYVYYGNRRALEDITLDVHESDIVTIIGSNGAGKTTTLKTICGLLKPREGTILFRDAPVEKRPAHVHARMGMSYVPEGGRVFRRLTVEENLEMGAFVRKEPQRMSGDLQIVYELFPALRERRNNPAGTLSGGERQMLSIGRSLMSNPVLLLLDEPSLGLSPVLVQQLMAAIKEINRNLGMTVFLVEQNVKQAMKLSNRVYVMKAGHIILEENGEKLLERGEWWDLF